MECYQDVWNIVLTFTNQFTFLIKIFRISEAEFQEIVKVKDADSDGFISCKEFLERRGGSSKKSDIAFEILDKYKKSFIADILNH